MGKQINKSDAERNAELFTLEKESILVCGQSLHGVEVGHTVRKFFAFVGSKLQS